MALEGNEDLKEEVKGADKSQLLNVFFANSQNAHQSIGRSS